MSDYAEADDIATEVFAKAIAAEVAGNGAHSHISGWLHRIAHNLVIDYYQQRDRRQEVTLDAVEPMPSREPSPHDIVQAAADHEWLERAITRLPADQADLIDMQRQGYSYDEMAAIMGRTLGATRALRHRALTALSRQAKKSRK